MIKLLKTDILIFYRFRIKKVFLIQLFLILITYAQAQQNTPQVTVSPLSKEICEGCTDLTATVNPGVSTKNYTVAPIPYQPYPFTTGTPVLVQIDDKWSPKIILPFCFSFFGKAYQSVIIGSNQIISFDVSEENNYCDFDLPGQGTLPSNKYPKACIMGPFQDIQPTFSGSTYYETFGTAPNRKFVVTFFDTPYFFCGSLRSTSQIVLHETTNYIDVIIRDKPRCSNWNKGLAIQGIQDETRSVGVAVPGRNNSAFVVNNEAQRFSPSVNYPYTIEWVSNTGQVVGTTDKITVCPTETTTYTAKVTIIDPCLGNRSATADATVTVVGIKNIALTSTPSACVVDDGTATATVAGDYGPFSYDWTPGSETSNHMTGLTTGTYEVKVTNAKGCTKSGTVVVGSLNTMVLAFNATAVNCFTNKGSATVTVTGGNPSFSYLWSNSATTSTIAFTGTGTASVTVTDQIGCKKTGSILVPPPDMPKPVINTNAPICFGEELKFEASNANSKGLPITYQWKGPNQFSNTNQNCVIAAVTNSNAGKYTLIMTENGCKDSVTTNVIVKPLPIVDFKADIVKGCSPLAVEFTDLSTPLGGQLEWAYGDGSESSANMNHTYVGSGILPVTLKKTVNGCSSTLTKKDYITLLARAKASFIANSPTTTNTTTTTVFDPIFNFLNTSQNASIYRWDLGFGFGSKNFNASQTYDTEPTSFEVSLFVNNENNCSDSIRKVFTITEPVLYYVPNAFTPNGSSVNDVFLPQFSSGHDRNYYVLQIFNRWGELVFESQQFEQGWDGNFKGIPAQEGVYAWKINYKLRRTAEIREITGHLNLIR